MAEDRIKEFLHSGDVEMMNLGLSIISGRAPIDEWRKEIEKYFDVISPSSKLDMQVFIKDESGIGGDIFTISVSPLGMMAHKLEGMFRMNFKHDVPLMNLSSMKSNIQLVDNKDGEFRWSIPEQQSVPYIVGSSNS